MIIGIVCGLFLLAGMLLAWVCVYVLRNYDMPTHCIIGICIMFACAEIGLGMLMAISCLSLSGGVE